MIVKDSLDFRLVFCYLRVLLDFDKCFPFLCGVSSENFLVIFTKFCVFVIPRYRDHLN